MMVLAQIEDVQTEPRTIRVLVEKVPERTIRARVYRELICPGDFPMFLKGRIGSLSVKDFAARRGVTPALVYALLSGKRSPSKDILQRLGLDVVYGVRDASAN